jgi:adenosylcobinamide-GDP ribazoletransferase
LLAAVRLLTVIPVARGRGTDSDAIARSPAFFPVVGLAIGGALGGLDYGLTQFLPDGVSAALVIASAIALTGALHLDGLADAADGLLGGRTPARRLEIMRDSSIGTFGAAVIGSSMLVRWAAIAALVSPSRVPAIIVAPLIGRTAALLLVWAFPYGRERGLGSGYSGVGWVAVILGHMFAAAAVFVLLGPWGLLAMGAALVIVWSLGRWAARRLEGGLTGDVYGAASEIAEVVALVVVVGLVEGGASAAPVWDYWD